jgi:hypothetical protein
MLTVYFSGTDAGSTATAQQIKQHNIDSGGHMRCIVLGMHEIIQQPTAKHSICRSMHHTVSSSDW